MRMSPVAEGDLRNPVMIQQQQLTGFPFLIKSNICSDALCDALFFPIENQKARKRSIYQHFRAFLQQGMRESNSHQRFWRPLSYHLTNPLCDQLTRYLYHTDGRIVNVYPQIFMAMSQAPQIAERTLPTFLQSPSKCTCLAFSRSGTG